MAYADYTDLMKITEDLLSGIVLKIKGSYLIKIHNEKGEEVEINF